MLYIMVPENRGIVKLSSIDTGINSINMAEKAPAMITKLCRSKSINSPMIEHTTKPANEPSRVLL